MRNSTEIANDIAYNNLKTLNPFGEESPIRYNPTRKNHAPLAYFSPGLEARKDRSLLTQFSHWVKNQNLNPLQGWWNATYEILLGNHFDVDGCCFSNDYGLSKGVLDLLILPLIARLLIVRMYLPEEYVPSTPLIDFLNWVFFVGPIEVVRFTLGISLWIGLFPVVMAFHMVKDVVDALRFTSLEEIKSLLPGGETPIIPNKKERASLSKYLSKQWKDDKHFLEALASTFDFFNGVEMEDSYQQGVLDWLLIFRVGRKLLVDLQKENRSHTWFFNGFAYVLGKTLLLTQWTLSGGLTLISTPGIFAVSLWKEILKVYESTFPSFSKQLTFGWDLFTDELLNTQSLPRGFLGLLFLIYGKRNSTQQWSIGLADILFLGIPLIANYLDFYLKERIGRENYHTPLLNFFSLIAILLADGLRWVGTVPLLLVSAPLVILVHFFKEIVTICSNGIDKNTFSELFVTDRNKDIITTFLEFIEYWYSPCELYEFLLGTHYRQPHDGCYLDRRPPRSQGLVDFLLLGLPFLSQKLIRDTGKDERSTTTLFNVAAWTVAIPIEILRFSVGVSLTAASYIPVVFMGLIGTFISECGNVCPTPSPGLHS